jgi:Secretion system C-terminal sorting domain
MTRFKMTLKKNLFTVSLVLIVANSFAQSLNDDWYDLNFEDTSTLQHLVIDSNMNHNNLWQVGVPQKTIFTSAHSFPKAIVTDITNPYPINDTSSFEVINLATGEGWQLPHTVILAGFYEVDSDTLTDFGTIEISPDNGTTWIDLINDTSYSLYYQWWTPEPVLTGNSDGWQQFSVWLAPLGPLFNVQVNDTILYRFTFYSDSIQTSRDGLMFDDLHFEDWAEGIQEFQNNNQILISPNPVTAELKIFTNKPVHNTHVQVINNFGQIVADIQNFNDETIDVSYLENGIYLLKYSDTTEFSIKKFIVQR